jgi:DNA-binding PadR family transcriptional regulator
MGEQRAIQGEFEHHVLLGVARLGEDAYTAQLVTELEERTGHGVSPSAVYVSLRRLEDKGLVASELRSGDAPGALRERRFFRLTEAGAEALRRSRAHLVRLWEGLEGLLGGERA